MVERDVRTLSEWKAVVVRELGVQPDHVTSRTSRTARREEGNKLAPSERSSPKCKRRILPKQRERLNADEEATLAAIKHMNTHVDRASLLKESFLYVFEVENRQAAEQRLREWLGKRSRTRALRPPRQTVREHLDEVLAFMDFGFTHVRLEGMTNQIRLICHKAFGFHSADPLIATIYLCRARVQLPQLQLI
jgi:transposase